MKKSKSLKALILVDLQNDFLPGGALAVQNGDQTIPIANQLMQEKGRLFDFVVATQDWHPSNHGSFASNQPGSRVGEVRTLGGLPQVLWPDHCVQETFGAQLVSGLDRDLIDRIVQKGTDPEIDSYSGFFDNGHKKATELNAFLKSQEVHEVIIMGLATDYCVKFTALDAIQLGYRTTLIQDGCRAVNLQPQDESQALTEMKASGVDILTSINFIAAKHQ